MAHDEVAEDCAAVYSGSSAGENSEGGTEEEYSEVAAVLGCSAGVHFVHGDSACIQSCSLPFAERNSEMLQHAMVVRSGEELQGLELFAVNCSMYAEGGWVKGDQWSCCYLG